MYYACDDAKDAHAGMTDVLDKEDMALVSALGTGKESYERSLIFTESLSCVLIPPTPLSRPQGCLAAGSNDPWNV